MQLPEKCVYDPRSHDTTGGCLQGGAAAQVCPAPADLEKGFRCRNLAYYGQCQLVVYKQHKGAAGSFKGGRGRRRSKKGHAEGSSDEEEGSQKDAASVFLQIQ